MRINTDHATYQWTYGSKITMEENHYYAYPCTVDVLPIDAIDFVLCVTLLERGLM